MAPPPQPIMHPLPSKPSSATAPPPPPAPSAASTAVAGRSTNHPLTSPATASRSPFLSQPQPASPRPAQLNSPYATGSSPKWSHAPTPLSSSVSTAAAGWGATATNTLAQPPEDPSISWSKKQIPKERLRPNSNLLQLGQGWKVHWKTWSGPPVAPSLHQASSSSSSSNPSSSSAPPPPQTGPNPAGASGSTASSSLAASSSNDPLRKSTNISSLKKAKMSAFDELMADVGAPSTSNTAPSSPVPSASNPGGAQPTPSTSNTVIIPPPLKDQLQPLHHLTPATDPVEKARLHVLRKAQENDSTRRLFGLFPFVRVTSPSAQQSQSPDDVKGKGKAKEDSSHTNRQLWVFSVTKGRDPENPGHDTDEGVSRAALNSFEFEGLTCVGNGHFSHRDLFPALYPTGTTTAAATSPSSTNATSASSTAQQQPSFVAPSSFQAKTFPSVIALSAELHSDLSPPQQNPSRTRGPYEAFIAAASESILVSMLRDASSPVENLGDGEDKRPTLTSRLGDCAVFLPAASEPFGTSGRRIIARAVRTSLKLSLHRHGVFIQSTTSDVAIRPYPITAAPRLDSPVLLAPFGTPAKFVKAYSSPSPSPSPLSNPSNLSTTKNSSSSETTSSSASAADDSITRTWKVALEGSGVDLAVDECWVLCKVDLPPTSLDDPSSTDSVEVVWPASLCLLDGTKPQPPRSTPSSTPPRPKPADLLLLDGNGGSISSSSDANPPFGNLTAPSANVALAPYDIVTRRRFASALRHRTSMSAGAASTPGYRDPIKMRAEKVGAMLEEMAEQRERKEREEREAAIAAAQAQAAQTPSSAAPTPMAVDGKGVLSTSTTAPPPPGGVLAGAPINMRTPISLGGSSTEAPSPADGFAALERQLGAYSMAQQIPMDQPGSSKHAELDQLYPSPPEVGSGGLSTATSMALSTNLPASIPAPQPSTDSLFASMDTNFAEFDWGDDFGTSRLQQSMPQDFDDGMGMMMNGLTDDDFSYFDDPAPAVPSTTLPTSFGGLQSSGPSPKFVDHFSHLTGAMPFASAASPSSPFGQPSPHHHHGMHHSPGILGFSFDPQTPHMTSNALGLGSSGTPHPADGSPFKTPKTPYSPFVELTDDQLLQDHSPAIQSGLSIAGTPAVSSYLRARGPSSGMFGAVQFGSSHAESDGKYDPRKGKFGLPSPESDVEEYQGSLTSSSGSRSPAKRPLSKAPWYATVCDPRVATAAALKKRRTLTLAKIKPQTALEKRGSASKVRPRSWIRTEVDSDHYGEDESEEEDMDVDENVVEMLRGSEVLALSSPSGIRAILEHSFSPSLLLLRQHLGVLLERVPRVIRAPTLPSKATTQSDSALDQAANILADQIIYNPDFRARAGDALLLRPTSNAPKLVSAFALRLSADHLTTFCNRRRIATRPAPLQIATPTLSDLETPAILLRQQQAVMSTQLSAVRFWRPMGFEPLSGGKEVFAFAVYEEGGDELNQAVKAWMKRVGDTYKASRLGDHIPGSMPGGEDGLVPLPAGSLSHPGIKEEMRTFCSQVTEIARTAKHIVVYLLTPPGPLPTAPTSPITLAIQQLLRTRSTTLSTLVYPIPMSTIADSRTMYFGDSSNARLERLAFAVFDQLLISVSKLRFPMPETFPSAAFNHATGPAVRAFQFPAITLSPARKSKLDFELSWPPSSLEVMHRHRLLHVGYTVIPVENESNLEWIVATCIDEKGELWKTVPKLVRCPASAPSEVARVKIVYAIARGVAEAADVEWRIVICRVGVMGKPEMKAWSTLLKEQLGTTKRPLHVTIACADMQPPVAVVELSAKATPVATPLPFTPMNTSGDAEEGEVTRTTVTGLTVVAKPAHLEPEVQTFAYTPLEPVAIGFNSDLIAPATTYLFHVPRIATLAHSSSGLATGDADSFPLLVSASPAAATGGMGVATRPCISVIGLHVLLAHYSPSSSLSITLGNHMSDLAQSFTELAALGRVRWSTQGKCPWHLEAAATVGELLKEVKQ
ncbi:hypothetical protein T439DRAFT_346312 [Meredithblackwellia eburnea MCA 4105]